MKRYWWLALAMIALIALLPACAKKDVAPPPTDLEEQEVAPPPPPPLEKVEEEPAEEIVEEEPIELEDVFFEFDKYAIQDKYKQVLARNAEILLAHDDIALLVEGHCDERGTNEYNISLGEKRAKAVMDFLATYGVPASRLSMVSYGEEKPFAYGHDEAAWAKNRRAHMVLR
ncbi:MAG: peptidoglycan-associated lipoprotein Pal [Candidatus Krumholzibacteriota bacterium]|nr:peptidoglycan-associated lipoprotein Pal [Candidatus Krumholzibacteriota bacterium]